MATIILTIIAVIAAAVAVVLAVRNSKLTKELSKKITLCDDAPVHKEKESEFMYKRRCVLKLQDDIIKAKGIVEKEGKIELTIFEQ